MADNLRRAVEEVLASGTRPFGVLVNGDCAYNSGQLTDYVRVMQLLAPLNEARIPVHLALGNHDDRNRFFSAASQCTNGRRRAIADRQAMIIRSERVNWFVLDSLEKTLSTPGLLGEEQLHWLAGALDANSRKPAIVIAHHNPALSGNSGLKDTAALFEILRPRKQVKAYVFGHTHTWTRQIDESGLHLVNLPPVAYVFKDGDPSGWVSAEVLKDGVQLDFHAIDRTHRNHGEKVSLKWRAA